MKKTYYAITFPDPKCPENFQKYNYVYWYGYNLWGTEIHKTNFYKTEKNAVTQADYLVKKGITTKYKIVQAEIVLKEESGC